MPAYRTKRFGFDFEAKARGEAHCAHHAEFIFCEAPVRLADSSNHVRLEISLPADVVEHFAGVVAHQQAVDGKVAALHVFLRHLRINHAVRVPAIAVTNVRAEGGHFDFQSVARNQNHAELRANRNAVRE